MTVHLTVYLVISLPKIPDMHRTCMVLANPTNDLMPLYPPKSLHECDRHRCSIYILVLLHVLHVLCHTNLAPVHTHPWGNHTPQEHLLR